ncbi:MAG: beta-galactosidase trimerization domain-containing protein [Spirochaetaceae bacterium]
MQQKIREFAPMPFAVVFLPWKGMTEEEMRTHFRTMRELGFTNLKQTMGSPEWPAKRILEVALEEGVIPFWYDIGGWERITPELLERLGLPSDMDVDEAIDSPIMLEYQAQVLLRRIHFDPLPKTAIEGTVLQDAGLSDWSGADIRLYNDPVLRDDAVPAFKAWVRRQYTTIEDLAVAWNQYEVGICDNPYTSWEEFEKSDLPERNIRREYGFVRDVLRFKADYSTERIRRRTVLARERDPEEPQRAGGEMGLFLPFAWRGTDMEGIAEAMKDAGSFYPSIHLAWHFQEVNLEVPRTIYMQASITQDWFKGGWAATWESTGGPQQLSGGKPISADATPLTAHEPPSFTVNAGTMQQLLLSYLAGGLKGCGLWSWNYRKAGWEGGEFALLNRQLRPGDRAKTAGAIARAAKRLRRELWSAHKEPVVGLLQNWENEAIWACVSERGRDIFRHYPIQARVGASRTLINGNIPWEHVTPSDLRGGLADRYDVIYLTGQLALEEDVLELLNSYVNRGGRVVLDSPGGWYNERGVVLNTAEGSVFERLFGAELADFQHTRNVPRSVGTVQVDGFVTEITPTRASVTQRFDTGEPAVTTHNLGAGTAVLLGFEAGRGCFEPGNDELEALVRGYILDGRSPGYSCNDTIVYRIAAPEADHYFLMNDAPARSVSLETPGYSYVGYEDPVTETAIENLSAISLPAYGARWIRCVKA